MRKESPPSKVGTLKTYERTLQSAAAASSKPSPSANWPSSVSETIVLKSCLYSEPEVPPHVPRHLTDAFLHSTWSCAHAAKS